MADRQSLVAAFDANRALDFLAAMVRHKSAERGDIPDYLDVARICLLTMLDICETA